MVTRGVLVLWVGVAVAGTSCRRVADPENAAEGPPQAPLDCTPVVEPQLACDRLHDLRAWFADPKNNTYRGPNIDNPADPDARATCYGVAALNAAMASLADFVPHTTGTKPQLCSALKKLIAGEAAALPCGSPCLCDEQYGPDWRECFLEAADVAQVSQDDPREILTDPSSLPAIQLPVTGADVLPFIEDILAGRIVEHLDFHGAAPAGLQGLKVVPQIALYVDIPKAPNGLHAILVQDVSGAVITAIDPNFPGALTTYTCTPADSSKIQKELETKLPPQASIRAASLVCNRTPEELEPGTSETPFTTSSVVLPMLYAVRAAEICAQPDEPPTPTALDPAIGVQCVLNGTQLHHSFKVLAAGPAHHMVQEIPPGSVVSEQHTLYPPDSTLTYQYYTPWRSVGCSVIATVAEPSHYEEAWEDWVENWLRGAANGPPYPQGFPICQEVALSDSDFLPSWPRGCVVLGP